MDICSNRRCRTNDLININRASFYFVAQVGYLNCKFDCIFTELVFVVGHLIKVLSFLSIHSTYGASICCFATRYKTPTVCRYVATQLNIKHLRCVDMLLRNSIYGRVATIRYISRFARNSICCLAATRVDCATQIVTSLALPSATHIERFSAISSRRHIERRVSGAYRRRVVVRDERLTRHVLSLETYRTL